MSPANAFLVLVASGLSIRGLTDYIHGRAICLEKCPYTGVKAVTIAHGSARKSAQTSSTEFSDALVSPGDLSCSGTDATVPRARTRSADTGCAFRHKAHYSSMTCKQAQSKCNCKFKFPRYRPYREHGGENSGAGDRSNKHTPFQSHPRLYHDTGQNISTASTLMSCCSNFGVRPRLGAAHRGQRLCAASEASRQRGASTAEA